MEEIDNKYIYDLFGHILNKFKYMINIKKDIIKNIKKIDNISDKTIILPNNKIYKIHKFFLPYLENSPFYRILIRNNNIFNFNKIIDEYIFIDNTMDKEKLTKYIIFNIFMEFCKTRFSRPSDNKLLYNENILDRFVLTNCYFSEELENIYIKRIYRNISKILFPYKKYIKIKLYTYNAEDLKYIIDILLNMTNYKINFFEDLHIYLPKPIYIDFDLIALVLLYHYPHTLRKYSGSILSNIDDKWNYLETNIDDCDYIEMDYDLEYINNLCNYVYDKEELLEKEKILTKQHLLYENMSKLKYLEISDVAKESFNIDMTTGDKLNIGRYIKIKHRKYKIYNKNPYYNNTCKLYSNEKFNIRWYKTDSYGIIKKCIKKYYQDKQKYIDKYGHKKFTPRYKHYSDSIYIM